MRTVWKYELSLVNKQKIVVPVAFKPLSVQIQNGTLCLWAVVNSACDMKDVLITIEGTGMECNCFEHTYVGTVQLSSILVFHVFAEDLCVS